MVSSTTVQEKNSEKQVESTTNSIVNPLPRDNYNNVVENTDTDNRKKEKHDTGNRKTLFSLSVSKDIHNTMKYSFWQHVGMLGFGVSPFVTASLRVVE